MGWLLDGLKAILFEIVNGALSGLADAYNAVMSVLPGMPSIPDMPSVITTAMAWLRWSPIPVDALAAFLAFSVTAYGVMFVWRPVARWLKVDD